MRSWKKTMGEVTVGPFLRTEWVMKAPLILRKSPMLAHGLTRPWLVTIELNKWRSR